VLLHKYYVDEGYDYVFTGRRKLGDVRLGVLGLGAASACSILMSSTAQSMRQDGSRASPQQFPAGGQVDHRRIGVNGPAILARMLSYPRACSNGSDAVVCLGDDRWIGRFCFLLRVSLKCSF